MGQSDVNVAAGFSCASPAHRIWLDAPGMTRSYPITVHWRQAGRTITHQVPEGDYILRSFEQQGEPLPFSCRNGCCTACAVRVLEGEIDQREALGLSRDLRGKGYGLLCVARATGPLVVETQDEDEVYELQFGRHFARGRVRAGLPLDEE
jgi:ferredoxin